ncbi:MAG: AAA family ATPase [Acidimicrobiales bacterium]
MADPNDDIMAKGMEIFQRLHSSAQGADDTNNPQVSGLDEVTEPKPVAEPKPDAEPKPVAETEVEVEADPMPASETDPPPAEHTNSADSGEIQPNPETPMPAADNEEHQVTGLDTQAAATALRQVVNRATAWTDRPLPRVIAIANQKGGVGKTTTAVNLGASLAEIGYRVLVADLDPQGNATTGLGINARNLETSIYDVIIHDAPIEDSIEPTALKNLFVVPATIDLAGAEIELVPAFSRELKLRKAIEVVIDDFDFVLIDCPPSLGLITVNGLAAAHEVLVPIQCEYYALEGLGQLIRNVHLVQGQLNPGLELSAIVLTMYDARTKLAEQVASEVRKHFGAKVCRNIIPRTVRLSEAPSFGQPITMFDPTSRGAIAYRELAKEVSGGTPHRTW